MKLSKPVERVVQLLVNNGYALVEEGLEVGSVRFDFSTVLMGARRSFDLVIVADTIEKAGSDLRRSVLALARALDMVESRRSLTLVIVGPQPNEIALRELSRVGRILLLGTPTGDSADESVRDSLAVLLPLDLPDEGIVAGSPLEEVRSRLPVPEREITNAFLDAAAHGSQDVREALRGRLIFALSEGR